MVDFGINEYGISAEELKQSYTRKFERNMTRW